MGIADGYCAVLVGPPGDGGNVGVLMVKCPVTGKEFSTGIETDEQSVDLIPATVAHALCPHCGTNHSWTMLEARLHEGGSHVE
jgi:hypothetical protein